jgi:hypothetical protein
MYAIAKWSSITGSTKAYYPTPTGDYGGEYSGGIGEGELVKVLSVDVENERLYIERLNGAKLVSPVYATDIATQGQMTIAVQLVNGEALLSPADVEVLVSRFAGQHALSEPDNNANYVGEAIREGEVLHTRGAIGAKGNPSDLMVEFLWKDSLGVPVTAFFDTKGSNHPTIIGGTKVAQWTILRPDTWASVPLYGATEPEPPEEPETPGVSSGMERRFVRAMLAGFTKWNGDLA